MSLSKLYGRTQVFSHVTINRRIGAIRWNQRHSKSPRSPTDAALTSCSKAFSHPSSVSVGQNTYQQSRTVLDLGPEPLAYTPQHSTMKESRSRSQTLPESMWSEENGNLPCAIVTLSSVASIFLHTILSSMNTMVGIAWRMPWWYSVRFANGRTF